jgi:hypothetical protein
MCTSALAQTPVQENTSLLVETSAAWCGPCGNWGTMFWGEMINDPYTAYHTMFVTIHPSWYTAKDSNELNYTLFSKVCDDWATLVDPWTLFPVFSHNLVDYMASAPNAGVMYNNMMDARDTFISHNPIASVGFTFKRTGNTFDVTTRTRFWQNVTGDYYVCAYLVEDSVLHEQSGSANALDTMRYVMRTSMSGSGSSWGDEIANGNIKAWSFYNKSFSYTVTDPSWDVTKMKALVVIYSKSGSTYSYVNGYNTATASSPDPTDVPNTQNIVKAVSLYPNPAHDKTDISINLDKDSKVVVDISDIAGHIVYTSGNLSLKQGLNTIPVSTSEMASGLYNVTVNSEDGESTQQLSVVK